MLGPVDYIVVGFKGNNFDGSIIEELGKAVQSGAIRVVDLVFIVKGADGKVAAGEFEDQSPELKEAFGDIGFGDDMPLFTEDDIDKIGATMENETAGGILVIEHLWAKGLKKALLDAGGVLIDEGRIHSDKIEAALEDIAQESK